MQQREIGTSGLRVSIVGLGCSNFGSRVNATAARPIIDRALDLGITFFDTADVYGHRGGSEACLGDALGARRKDVVLATKFGRPMDDQGRPCDASRAHIMRAVEGSLRRLRTDWIDLYQLHWPDPDTPIEETLRALDDLVRAGKIRAVGCSNLSAAELSAAHAAAAGAGIRGFVSAQAEYSLLAREVERALIPTAREHGIALLPYLPLAGGLLSGKYRRGAAVGRFAEETADKVIRDQANRYLTEGNLATVERLAALAESHGRSSIELAFGWLLAQPLVPAVLAGATRPEQVDQNVAASTWSLTADELTAIDEITAASRPTA